MALGYLIAWCIYLAGVVFACAIIWYWTRNMAVVEFRKVVRTCFACLLLTPYYSDAEQTFLAPAYIVCVFDVMQEGIEAVGKAGTPLLLVMFCAIIFSLFLGTNEKQN